MSYYESRIKALEEKVAEMAKRERMKAIPIEAQLIDSISSLKSDLHNCYTAIRVKDEEIARLKAEVERLTQEYSDATNHYNKLHNDLEVEVERLKHQLKLCGEIEVLASVSTGKSILPEIFENENLRAEVERLRKAGDVMYNGYIRIYGGHVGNLAEEYTAAWNAAKEGKQSV